MNKQATARRLLRIAKRLVGGTWALPKNERDAKKIVMMAKRMENGMEPMPGEFSVGNAFHGILGNDSFYDDVDGARKVFYQRCSRAVRAVVKELVLQPRDSFKRPNEYDMIVEVWNQLK